MTSMDDLTYIYREGKVVAIRDGEFVASAETLAEVEKLAFETPHVSPLGYHGEPEVPRGHPDYLDYGGYDPEGGQPCPHNAHWRHCAECNPDGIEDPAGLAHPGDVRLPDEPHQPHNLGSTIVGPGGQKGTMLAKVRDLWGEEIAVRFENGRIAHLRVQTDGSLQGGFKASTEKTASTTGNDDLVARIDSDFPEDHAGLTARLAENMSIRDDARARMASASPADASQLDSIILTTEAERGTLRQAIAAIDADNAANADSAPYVVHAAPAQETLGRGDGNWLDSVVGAMIAEAEGQDFEQIVREGSTLFVTDLPDMVLADTAVTRDVASTHIRSLTAGLDPELAEPIQRDFLAKVEEVRKSEASSRQSATHKEAATREDQYKDLPDDILFS